MNQKNRTYRILVTGAGGMIGSAVVSELCKKESFEVIACYHKLPDELLVKDNLRITTCDLLRPEERKRLIKKWKPDCLVHLAWCGTGNGLNNDKVQIKWVEASLSLIRTFTEYGGHRFIGCGTIQEYGVSSSTLVISEENTVPQPVSLYGKCKLTLCDGLNAIAHACGISALWPRIGYVIGRGCSETLLFGEALKAAATKKDFICRIAPDTAFDALYVRDLGRLYALAVEDECFTGTVNFGTGRTVNVRALLEHIFALGNCPEKLHYAIPLNPRQTAVLDNSRLIKRFHIDDFRDLLTLQAEDLWGD